MAAKKKTIKTPKGDISCYCDTLSYLIDSLIKRGVSSEDFNKVEIELDYSDCYYPDDSPSIQASWPNIYYEK